MIILDFCVKAALMMTLKQPHLAQINKNLRLCSFWRKRGKTQHSYPIVKKLFLKYIALIPSSAPVERLFSFAGMIVRPHRRCMSDKSFEQLLLLKDNWSKAVFTTECDFSNFAKLINCFNYYRSICKISLATFVMRLDQNSSVILFEDNEIKFHFAFSK